MTRSDLADHGEDDREVERILASWAETDSRFGSIAERRADRARRGSLFDVLATRLDRRSRRSPGGRLELRPKSPRSTSVVVPTALASGQVLDRTRIYAVSLIGQLVDSLGDSDEVVLVLDDAADQGRADSLRSQLRDPRVRVVHAGGPFSFSDRVNRGVAASRGEVVVLLNDDTEILERSWLGTIASAACAEGIGAVGATLLHEDGSLQHAGVTTTTGLPTHAWSGWPRSGGVDAELLAGDREAWAVTGACLAVTRSHWDLVGGFSPVFGVNYNDVDFCLKLSESGLANVVLASVVLYHFESRSRRPEVSQAEMKAVQRRWWHRLGEDPLVAGTSALVERGPEEHD